MANNNNWGGAREGAGRPAGVMTVQLCVRISREAAGKQEINGWTNYK